MSQIKSQITELEQIATKLRFSIVNIIGSGIPGHMGGSCSIVDVITIQYLHKGEFKIITP